MTIDYKSKFTSLYDTARFFVVNNDAAEARTYVIAYVKVAQKLYHAQTGIVQKAKTAAFILKWVEIAALLREQGITDEVKACFGLLSAAQCVEAPKTDSAMPGKPEKKAGPAPKPSDDIDIDELYKSSNASQDLCADIFEQYKSAVVSIRVSSENGGASGTGFFISQNGYLLTNDHVVRIDESGEYYPKIQMYFKEDSKCYPLTVIASDKKWDVALCKFTPEELTRFSVLPRIKDYSFLRQGTEVVIIGNRFSMGLGPIPGTVLYTQDDDGNLVSTALSNHGDSGGPVINRNGECVGINKSTIKSVVMGNGSEVEANGMANATPMNQIERLLQKWSKEKNIVI